ncbi:MAG: cysteine desulfurase [Pseudomonadota bacterium]
MKQPNSHLIADIRKEFPILETKIHDDKPLIYLDNGASAQKPKCVIEAMSNIMQHCYSNVHRGLHYMSEQTTLAYENARKRIAGFLNADEKEIIFTNSATNAINLVAYAFGRHLLKKGDEVIVTLMEHHSNFVPWQILRDQHGVVLKFAPVDQNGNLDLEAFAQLFSKKTKLVCVAHVSNVLGTLNPINKLADMAHAHGAIILVDGSQAVMHQPVDVKALDVDFYVFTGHKIYGPTGIGILYGRYQLLDHMEPFMGGGEMISSVTPEKSEWAKPPAKFEAGTPAIIEAIGLGRAIQFVEEIGFDTISAHENFLLDAATNALQTIEGLTIHGRAQQKGPIISLSIKNLHPYDIATILDREGIATRAGHHCAEPLAQCLNIGSTLRASMAIYNTVEEIDALVNGLSKAKKMLS